MKSILAALAIRPIRQSGDNHAAWHNAGCATHLHVMSDPLSDREQ